jgi:hypothetical protein
LGPGMISAPFLPHCRLTPAVTRGQNSISGDKTGQKVT